MRVFLSWSGASSKKVAEALNDWLPSVIQSLEPWYSPEDIQKGTRWTQELADSLESSPVGVFCLTSENLTAPWILFEAGAISKMRDSSVFTLLLDIKPSTVEQPLGQFNHTIAEQEDIFQFLVGINQKVGERGERKLSDEQLRQAFTVWWPALQAKLIEAQNMPSRTSSPTRSTGDILGEVLEMLRTQDRNFNSLAQEIEQIKKWQGEMAVRNNDSKGERSEISKIQNHYIHLVLERDIARDRIVILRENILQAEDEKDIATYHDDLDKQLDYISNLEKRMELLRKKIPPYAPTKIEKF